MKITDSAMKIVDEKTEQKPLAMIVDDDLSLRIAIGAALRKAGFETVDAANGMLAVSIFQSRMPDLILLDVMMPGMDGFETCRSIRNLPGGTYSQILMVTGLDDSESTAKSFEAGANDFVSKPINWVMLGHRARYMLRTSQMFRELLRSQLRLQKNQALAKQGGWQIDYSDNSMESHFSISPEACQILGLKQKQHHFIGYDDFFSLILPDERDRVRRSIESALYMKEPFSISYKIQLPDQSVKHILNQGEILDNEKGETDIMMGIVQDITQMKQAEAEIRQLAFYDGLTGLANRMLFHNRLTKLILSAKRETNSFALLFLDIDHFKLINDTLGHHAGDILLKNTAIKIKEVLREADTVALAGREPFEHTLARLGGDEFILLIDDIGEPEKAALIARRLLKVVQTPCLIDGKEVSVTASIGISVFPEDGQIADVLLKHADSAMYHAKGMGRNNYQFFMESLNTATMERFSLEQDLKKALDNDEFKLYYQPQIRLANRTIVGAEALIRWIHPEKGFIPPDRFIPIAEESGMIVTINNWVIKTACHQSRKWREKGLPDVRIAVNLSGYRLAEQNIIAVLRDTLADNALEGTNIEVEVTENILMQDTASIIRTLKEMKELKLKIALDDFGTGYSSLSYLTSFDVDTIKIDRSFVMACTENEKNRVIIKAIIALGHSLNMSIVAEGIETEGEYELLRSYGCDDCQGYFFSPPVPEDKFAALLQNGSL